MGKRLDAELDKMLKGQGGSLEACLCLSVPYDLLMMLTYGIGRREGAHESRRTLCAALSQRTEFDEVAL